jgi:hypothetical protein
MKTEMSNEREAVKNVPVMVATQHVLFARTPKGITVGVVSDAEPSSLTLLAAGVAGMAERHARRERTKKKEASL